MTLNIELPTIILWLITPLCLWVSKRALEDDEIFAAIVALILGLGLAYWGYREADPTVQAVSAEKDRIKAQAAAEQRKADETPHVIRETDGCKVYAFKSGERWHYFTRCPGEHTTTDTAYEHCTGSGKSRRCEELHDTIDTIETR